MSTLEWIEEGLRGGGRQHQMEIGQGLRFEDEPEVSVLAEAKSFNGPNTYLQSMRDYLA